MRDIDSEAIVGAARRWRDARLASQAAGIEKSVAGLAYRADPGAMASGAQARYAKACREVVVVRRRERSALLALEKAYAPARSALQAAEGAEGSL